MIRYILFILCLNLTAGEVTTLKIAGSDTMLPLAQRWARAYMIQFQGVVVEVEGGGSRTGIEKLIRGKVSFCASSRPLQPEEIKRLHERQGSLGISTLTAKDALSVYLHPENPVTNLTMAQLKGIFTGQITNWKELGGPDLPILVISRQPNSGTRLFFREHVLRDEAFLENTRTVPNTRGVVHQVRANPGAIGYGGYSYREGLSLASIDGVSLLPENVVNDTYPLTRYLYLYTVSPMEGPRRDFINWVMGKEGQKIVVESGYFPLWKE